MAQRPVLDEVDDDDLEEVEDDLWPVNIETGLLAKIRASGVDIEDALEEHALACQERDGPVTATVAHLPSNEMFVVLTAQDPLHGIEGTFVFPVQRQR